jgi:hypothetical protein
MEHQLSRLGDVYRYRNKPWMVRLTDPCLIPHCTQQLPFGQH